MYSVCIAVDTNTEVKESTTTANSSIFPTSTTAIDTSSQPKPKCKANVYVLVSL